MKKNITCIFILCLLTAVSSVRSQEKEPVMMQMPASGYEFSDTLKSTAVPFRLSGNHVVIQAALNGKILDLILDSGMPVEGALLFGGTRVDSANLSFSGKMPVGGVGGKEILADLSMGAVLKVPDLKMTNQMIIVMPHDPVLSLHFAGIDGIIGFSFFANFVVEIDYEEQQLILTKPEAFNRIDAGQKVPVEVRGNRIFLMAQIELESGLSVPVELVVDTGNRSALILNTAYRKEIVHPSKFISVFAHGLTSKLSRKAGRINSLTVGGYTLTNIISLFNDGTEEPTPPWEKEGNLGSEIFRRFRIIFDIPGKQIYLNPNRMFSEPFEFNMAGLQFERSEDRMLTVVHVIPGSPADNAMIVPGDKIISINNRDASQFTNEEADKEFKNPGTEVSIVIERSGKLINVLLRLIRLI